MFSFRLQKTHKQTNTLRALTSNAFGKPNGVRVEMISSGVFIWRTVLGADKITIN